MELGGETLRPSMSWSVFEADSEADEEDVPYSETVKL
jgi:hypothetical protein